MEEQGPTIQDQLQTAMEAESKGIPVDWKSLCIQTYNAAMAEIQRLQNELDGAGKDEEAA